MNDDKIGETKVKALLTLLISETLDFYSISNSMSDSQIAMTVNLILDDFSAYKPDFFMWVFDNAKKGRYGKNYNRIDGQIIFEWLNVGDADYTEQIEHQRLNEHKRIMFNNDDPEDKGVPMPEYVKETILNISKSKILPTVEKPVNEQQKIINQYISDFNKIFDVQDDGKGGKKFISFENKMIDVSEYIEYRIKLNELNHDQNLHKKRNYILLQLRRIHQTKTSKIENRKELDYKLITDLDGAKPAFERLQQLTMEKIKLTERYQNLKIIGDNKKANELGFEINKLKLEMSLIRESVEYVRIKAFILCAKSYLTRSQMKEIGERAEELLASPEIHLIGKHQ